MFAHLHLRSSYTKLSALASPRELCAALSSAGCVGGALTDSGSVVGLVEWFEAARACSLRAAIGVELWTAEEPPPDHPEDLPLPGHQVVLIARGERGFRNLCRVVTAAHRRWNFAPRTTARDLAEMGEDLVVLTGARWGALRDPALAERRVRELAAAAPGRTWVELTDLGEEGDEERCELGRDVARRLSLPLVATNDVRHVAPEDAGVLEMAVRIGGGDPSSGAWIQTDQAYLKTPSEMGELFSRDELLESVRILESCDFEPRLGTAMLPRIPTEGTPREAWEEARRVFPPSARLGAPPEDPPQDEGSATDQWFTWCARDGLRVRLLEHPEALRFGTEDQYRERLEMELGVITRMDYAAYHLIVMEFICWAKDRGIQVGPGRGSAAGSLACWALRITDCNPLQHGLLFERFLNPERRGLPDIDVDFEQERREEVVTHVRQKYGEDRVGQILTVGRMKAKMAIKDVARACGVGFDAADSWSSRVDDGPKVKLSSALREPHLAALREGDPVFRRVAALALRLEGLPRQFGAHAAGVVVASDPLTGFCPVHRDSDGKDFVGLDMVAAEKVGLVKFDFLGLKALDVIEAARRSVERRTGTLPEVTDGLLDDPAVYELASSADTLGLFQVESPGMIRLIRKMRPDCFDDLVALLALFRPGPLQSGMVDDYVERKHGEQETRYIHPLLENDTRNTHGILVFQEQCAVEGSFVWTSRGPTRIERVREGDLVTTSGGNRRVLTVRSSGEKECLKITTSMGSVSLSACHPVKVRRSNGEVFVRADEIVEDDLVCVPDPSHLPPLSREIDVHRASEAWRLGYCAGNLCKNRSSVNISVSDSEDRARAVAAMFSEWGTAKIYFHTRCWYVSLSDAASHHMPKIAGVSNSRPVVKLKEAGLFNKRAQDKTAPTAILESNRFDEIAGYLLGLLDSDGHVPSAESKQSISITSTSPEHVSQIHWLCWRIGIFSRVRENRVYLDDVDELTEVARTIRALKDYSPKLMSGLPRWIGEIRVFCADDLHGLGVEPIANKKFIMPRDVKTMRRRLEEMQLPTYARVTSIAKIGLARVYDLGVDGVHEFCIDGHVVHNCMSAARNLAGFTYGEADLLRRAMGKKKPDEMAKQRAKFLSGCASRGIEEQEASRVFQLIDYFSGYGFNRCLSGETRVLRAGANATQPDPWISLSELYEAQQSRTPWGKKIRSGKLRLVHMSDDGRLRPSKMVRVYEIGERPTFRVSTATKSIVATENHRLLTTSGYVTVSELVVGKTELVCCGEAEERREAHHHREFGKSYTNRVGERGMPHGRDNPGWIDGRSTAKRLAYAAVSERASGRCESCGAIPRTSKHALEHAHLESLERLGGEFSRYHSAENIRLLCNSCHKTLDYHKGERKKRWTRGIPTVSEVVLSVEPAGVRCVYDVEMEGPDHNFLADGIVSHNSHSAAYGLVTYQTAKLKAHHRADFMAAAMTYDAGNHDQLRAYVADTRRAGVLVLRPCVNASQARFTVEGDPPAVRYGLRAVHGLGPAALRTLLEERERGGPYRSVEELRERTGAGKAVLEALVWSGAVDGIERDRHEAWWVATRPPPRPLPKRVAAGQLGLFSGGKTAGEEHEERQREREREERPPPPTFAERMELEARALGSVLSDHPLRRFSDVAQRVRSHSIRDLYDLRSGVPVVVAAHVESAVRLRGKGSDGEYVRAVAEDGDSSIQVVLRGSAAERFASEVVAGACLRIDGVMDVGDDDVTLTCTGVERLASVRRRASRTLELDLEPSSVGKLDALAELLRKRRDSSGTRVRVRFIGRDERVRIADLDYRVELEEEDLDAIERITGRPCSLHLPGG